MLAKFEMSLLNNTQQLSVATVSMLQIRSIARVYTYDDDDKIQQ